MSLNLEKQNETNVDAVRAFLFNNTTGQREVQLIAMAPSSTTEQTRIYQGQADCLLSSSDEYSIIAEVIGNAAGVPVIPVLNYAATEVVFESLKL